MSDAGIDQLDNSGLVTCLFDINWCNWKTKQVPNHDDWEDDLLYAV